MESNEEFIPRDYQIDLYEEALRSNVILYLPTGAGKTFIAIMLIKKLSSAVRVPWHEGGKRTVYAVNTVPLVAQQCSYISRHVDLTCGGFSGDINIDMWQKDQWIAEFEKNQVLVMTAQILVDLLNHTFLPLSRINLIIFDECHHAVGHHPMRQVMKTFEHYNNRDHPKVLGMSATLLNCHVNAKNALALIQELELTFHAKIISVNNTASMSKYGKPCEKLISFNSPVQNPLEDELKKVINDVIMILKVVNMPGRKFEESDYWRSKKKTIKLPYAFEDIKFYITCMGPYIGKLVILQYLVRFEKLKMSIGAAQSVTVLNFLKTQMMKMQKMIENAMNERTEIENMIKYSSDKIIRLFTVIKDSYDQLSLKNEKFCCIIFVQKRLTAKILYYALKKLGDLHEYYRFLMPEYVVGSNSNTSNNLVENMCLIKWNVNGLMKFRSGEINCLVSTKVLDEGVDIPQCALVINFDKPENFRSYVQCRGRARSESGNFMIFIESGDVKFQERYKEYQNVELILQYFLIGNTTKRTEPLPKNIKHFFYGNEIIKPYTVRNKMGVYSQISEVSAIPLVNKYCMKLSKSKLVNAVPIFKVYEVIQNIKEVKYLVTIRLPSLSPLRSVIYGDVMSSTLLARRSAAMAVCKKLYEIGELTDKLLPREACDIAEDITTLLKYWQDELPENKNKVGTLNNKRSYELVYPKVFCEAFPQPDKDVYLHIIDMKPNFTPPTDNRKHVLYDLLNSQSNFAILSSKKMPELPKFVIYMNVGEVKVKLRANYQTLKLSSTEIKELNQFHWIVFHDVLGLIKDFMLYDRSNTENSFLVVPVDEKWNINWAVVRRKDDELTKNYYNWELVLPNYWTSPSTYIVTRVRDHLTPQSAFPVEAYTSYIHYFAEKYGFTISNISQPLLEVKAISNDINFIRNKRQNAIEKKQDKYREYLVPELCRGINFSSLYWLKARALPSILHRITQLLIADDLRLQIVNDSRSYTSLRTESKENKESVYFFNDQLPNNTQLLRENVSDAELCNQIEDITLEESSLDNVTNDTKAEAEIDLLNLNSNVYSWIKEKEPCDLDRNIQEVRLMDIEYYNSFISSMHNTSNEIDEQKNSKVKNIQPVEKAPNLHILHKITAHGVTAIDILPALTARCAQDSFNLKNLETLGDSTLKFIVSLYFFEQYPDQSEGILSGYKDKIIGNRHLYYCGINKKLPGRLKVDHFDPKTNFVVPAYCVPRKIQHLVRENNKASSVLYEMKIPRSDQLEGVLSDENQHAFADRISSWIDATIATGAEHFVGTQISADKIIADAVEALTGVYLKCMGVYGATKFLQCFGVLPDQASIQKILYDSPKTAAIGNGDPNIHMPWASNIENILGYEFKDRSFLLQAFTHASYSPNLITLSYERLEFLGDAIIDFLITIYIYENCSNLTPGELTDLRSALVNNIIFACLTVKYKLHTALLSHTPVLFGRIEKFVKFQEQRNHIVNDELLWILSEGDCDMVENIDVPKVLGDLFEAVFGAIFLDSGKDLNVVWNILYSLMSNEINQFSKNIPKQPIRALYETSGVTSKFLKSTILEDSGKIMVTLEIQVKDNRKHFYGFGSSEKRAKDGAAKRALKYIWRLI